MPDENYLPWGDDDPDEDSYELSGFDDHDPESAFLKTILQEVGLESIDEILVDFDAVNPSTIRSVRFASLTDAIVWLNAIGLLGFSGVFRYESGDYGAATSEVSGDATGFLLMGSSDE